MTKQNAEAPFNRKLPHALAGSRSTICHADSHTHGGPRDAATWDKTMRPPVHRPPPGKMPAAGGCGSRARGGKGRPAKFGCSWDRVGKPQLSPGGLARAELVCPELSPVRMPSWKGRLARSSRAPRARTTTAPRLGGGRSQSLGFRGIRAQKKAGGRGRHLRAPRAPTAGGGEREQAGSRGPRACSPSDARLGESAPCGETWLQRNKSQGCAIRS